MAIKYCNDIDRNNLRIVRIHTTMELEHIEISEALLAEAELNENITILGPAREWRFDDLGKLL